MVCKSCRDGSHQVCIDKNVDRHPADCYCQHRTTQKTIVLPTAIRTELEVLLPQVR